MLRAVDALGEGPFTLDPTEFGMLRSSPITTRSGNQIQPALIVRVALLGMRASLLLYSLRALRRTTDAYRAHYYVAPTPR